jgi:hypothetical protein
MQTHINYALELFCPACTIHFTGVGVDFDRVYRRYG